MTPGMAEQASRSFVCEGGSMGTSEASPISRMYLRVVCAGMSVSCEEEQAESVRGCVLVRRRRGICSRRTVVE